ncbi:aminotransferase class V [Deinococcus cellulosilyticus NBRC 106333 = KACC 11606]|uniref:Aminotransferase class V n=2 Tax=Deinococcus cellulosilyticus TaxID=401558 RepID=A0A511N615_DEIC1|nr:aminotransferase class V [Deinococcus cellulosilyticus NBRC 106333 = KACC 11606]
MSQNTDLLLLTPGPTPIQPDALQALLIPMVGHMDPAVFALNARIQANLKVLYGAAADAFTALVAGTGSLGMETGFANLIEPGDTVVVATNGSFGDRMVEMCERYGAKVIVVRAPIGEAVRLEDVEKALKEHQPKMVSVVHGETSTGVLNPAPEIARMAQDMGILVTVDAVTTAGMMPYEMEKWGIDYAYTGSQKCLSAPPGVAPVAVSARAMEVVRNRKTPVTLWYSDFLGLQAYWDHRDYHHTIPVQLHYSLDAALSAALNEGLDVRARHAAELSVAVARTLETIGFSHFVKNPRERLPSVLSLRLPEGMNDLQVRTALREKGISITGGLDATRGLIWRLGLMGEAARTEHYMRFMRTLDEILGHRHLESTLEQNLTAVHA